MTNLKRGLVTLPLIILLCIAIWAVYEYRKPHTGAGNKTTDVQTDAISLYNDFAKNETSANAKYLDKIIEVSGKVDDIENANGAIVVMLNADQMMGGISCKMFDSTNTSLKKGDKIIIKGKCAGFLSDVNLVDCVLINN
jgi:hypothetical protein